MLYSHYVQFVKERAGLASGRGAEEAIRAVFEALDMMMTVDQAEALAETVPVEIRPYLGANRLRYRFDREQFRERIALQQGVDPGTADRQAAAVLSVLAEYLPSPALLVALEGLPREIRVLFNWMKKAA